MSRYMLLWLEGPLQSWGSDSAFNRRETGNFPTLSGILGMICAACGKEGPQAEFLEASRGCFFEAKAYRPAAQNPYERAARDVTRMVDFHMVGSAYDSKDKWQSLMIPKTTDGKSAVGGGAKMTFRYYLQESAFSVILEVPSEYAEEVVLGMENPERALFLGRRNCVPTDLIFRGMFEAAEQAREAADGIRALKQKELKFTVSSEEGGDEALYIKDAPIQFGEAKQYSTRQVFITYG